MAGCKPCIHSPTGEYPFNKKPEECECSSGFLRLGESIHPKLEIHSASMHSDFIKPETKVSKMKRVPMTAVPAYGRLSLYLLAFGSLIMAYSNWRECISRDSVRQKTQAKKGRYFSKPPVEGMPVRCLQYTYPGEPDKRLDCKNFDRLEADRKYFRVYWYDENGEMIAADICAQWEDDEEFMLKSFSQYYPRLSGRGQSFASESSADTEAEKRKKRGHEYHVPAFAVPAVIFSCRWSGRSRRFRRRSAHRPCWFSPCRCPARRSAARRRRA